jgi:tRNA 2-thiouridine synthesizing protein E
MQVTQDNPMTQFTSNAQDSETSSLYADIRRAELRDQRWNRNKSVALAKREGISLNDEHWAVIVYLRSYYLEHGLPRFARTTASALKQQFSAQGGYKYLYQLFAGGPVTQGSRLANLRLPANATDVSFGTSY